MSESIIEIVNGNIQKIIKCRGISQRKLAKNIGVTPAAVSLWFNKKRLPNRKSLDKICGYLGIEQQELCKRGELKDAIHG